MTHDAAWELEDGVFQRTQGLDVQIVGRFVQQIALQQSGCQMQAPTFTAGQRADQLLLVGPAEVESADGARLDFDLPMVRMSLPPEMAWNRRLSVPVNRDWST